MRLAAHDGDARARAGGARAPAGPQHAPQRRRLPRSAGAAFGAAALGLGALGWHVTWTMRLGRRPHSSGFSRRAAPEPVADPLPSAPAAEEPGDLPDSLLPLLERAAGPLDSTARCVHHVPWNQQKCMFKWLLVRENQFWLVGDARGKHPNPLYAADDRTGSLRTTHKYNGHRIGRAGRRACKWLLRRPTVFMFRASGHSTFHLWENNLGPFWDTLQMWPELRPAVRDPQQLIVAYVDNKPAEGPRAPKLLDRLLQGFSALPLLNASRIRRGGVCFETAAVGIAAGEWNDPHGLIWQMKEHLGAVPRAAAAEAPPEVPRVAYISRNHRSVSRGRKVVNEDEVVAALNATVLQLTGGALQFLHMQDLAFEEQVREADRTQIMLGPHGGGIAHCAWMRPGSVVLEFAPKRTASHRVSGGRIDMVYHRMCQRSGVAHFFRMAADAGEGGAEGGGSTAGAAPALYANMWVNTTQAAAWVRTAVQEYARQRAAGAAPASPSGKRRGKQPKDASGPPCSGVWCRKRV
eukprot:TRINITY_DN11549_c1_g1_i1.p1 TRINITY_DN11549_c1_g1~~TRINITY_DN11549_c1_g1_i1.p1  ORF type:complete len:521 (+),score=139.05 TRINITY_DN11549_c1_g1_i1:181-1743(+)